MSLSIAQSQKKLLALQREGENKLCFECKAVNPQWASPKHGIFICLECAGTHRSLGVHISFVRSVTMDQFKPEELKLMEIGGNERARVYFEENGIDDSVSIKDKYNSTVAEDYREMLSAEARGEPWTRRDRPVHIPHSDDAAAGKDESSAAIKQFQKPAAPPADPTLNDLASDALGAITSGWGWFSQTVSQSVSETTENYIRPGMRQFADSDLGSNARKAMEQFGRRAKEAGAYGAEQLNHAIENLGLEEQQRQDSEFAQLFEGWTPRDKARATEHAGTKAEASEPGESAPAAEAPATTKQTNDTTRTPESDAQSKPAGKPTDKPAGNPADTPAASKKNE